MPQLDPNIFLTQYISVILLLTSIYIILGYIVLPLTLRSLLIRGLFLSTNVYGYLANPKLPPILYLINLTKKPVYLEQLLNTAMKNLFFFQKVFLSLVQKTLFVSCNTNLDKGHSLVGVHQLLLLECILSYLVMFLSVSDYTND